MTGRLASAGSQPERGLRRRIPVKRGGAADKRMMAVELIRLSAARLLDFGQRLPQGCARMQRRRDETLTCTCSAGASVAARRVTEGGTL